MIWAIEILSVPAGRKRYGGADAIGAWCQREFGGVVAIARFSGAADSVAAVAYASEGAVFGSELGVAGEHAEAL